MPMPALPARPVQAQTRGLHAVTGPQWREQYFRLQNGRTAGMTSTFDLRQGRIKRETSLVFGKAVLAVFLDCQCINESFSAFGVADVQHASSG